MIEMLIFISPLLACTFGNAMYNVIGKSIPSAANAFASLSITYLTGLILCVAIFYLTNPGGNIIEAVAQANWASYFLGLTIVFIDLSLILLYRSGWDISIGTLVANIGMSVCLVPVGVLIWEEGMTWQKAVGIVICLVGLWIVNAPDKKQAEQSESSVPSNDAALLTDSSAKLDA